MKEENNLEVLYFTPHYTGTPSPLFPRMHDLWQFMNRLENPPFKYKIYATYGSKIDSENIKIPYNDYRPYFKRSETFRRFFEKIFITNMLKREQFTIFHPIHFDSTAVHFSKILKKNKDIKIVTGPPIIGYFKMRKSDRYDLRKMTFLKQIKSQIRYNLMKKYLTSDLFDKIIAVSDYHIEMYKEVGVPESKIYKIPPYVDPKNYGKKISSEDKGTFKILYLGSFSKFKGVDIFLEALELLKKETDINFKGILVGKGEYPIEKHSSIEDDIGVIGYVDRSEVSNYFNKADVYVHPGIEECGPTTIIESLACGTPYIATDRLAFRCFDTQNVGKFFELRNPRDLKRRLVEFYYEDKKSFNNSEYFLNNNVILDLRDFYKVI